MAYMLRELSHRKRIINTEGPCAKVSSFLGSGDMEEAGPSAGMKTEEGHTISSGNWVH